MALSQLERRLADEHRRVQLRLSALTVTEMRALWRLIDPDDLSSVDPWLSGAVRLIRDQHEASAALARRYVRQVRGLSLGSPPAGALPVPALSVESLRTSLMVTGPVKILRAQRRGTPVESAVSLGEQETARAASRHALTGGRETIAQYARTDHRAGWARITSGNACDFCSMLAGRGAVYSAETVNFQAHDGCGCSGALEFR